ncbi:restriction endonuclease subunit S [Jannaschia formosa]|uniref:restriction endonuclease subunit S n=1 Tax=Jannaschia formosa TaxID=2259592 RepID=UPI000E1C1BE6|nr:restriction endonuclease subunit S [Jannaschia formosa]TFL18467.1 restriction endonuclease [Jannaschia formosa]
MSWPMVALGEVCDTGSGGTPSRTNSAYYGGGIPWVKSGELLSDIITSTEETISEEGLKKSSAKLLEPGCILLAMYGASIGKTATLGIRAATNQAVCNIRPKDDRISTDFIRIFLEYLKPSLIRRGAGGAQPNISQNIIRDTEIPLPPLDEQRRIAGILDAADALRRRRREALALLDTLPGAIFAEMFGDPSTNRYGYEAGTIGDLLDDVRYGTSNKAGDEGALPILRMGNITSQGRMDLADLKRIDLPDKDIPKHTVRKGDILFNRTNSADLVGKTAIFMEEERYAFAGYLVRARVSNGNRPEYVAGYLNSPHGKKVLRNMAKNIVGMANINAKEMQSIPILLAPESKQESYAKQCAQIGERRATLMDHLSQLETLFASLQSRAFAGAL